MPAKKKGYTIYPSNKGKNSPLYVKISIRNAEGRSTTKKIGSIGRRSDFSSTEEMEKKAAVVYEEWKKANSGNIATIVLDCEKDSDFPTLHLGRLYIAKYLRELGLIEKLGNLKGEKKAKYQFDLASIVETLIESQILCPGSKRNEFLSDKGLGFDKDVRLHDIYRALDVLAAHSAEINAYSYKKIKEHDGKNTNVYYYDCTNFYYTQGSEGELLGTKKAKEGMVAPLVQMGLLIDEWGYLIGMVIFEGKSNEQPSLEAQIRQISQHISMSSVIVCTDAGLCSFKNKMLLSRDGRAYITTQPVLGKAVPSMVKDYVTLDSNFRTSAGAEYKVEKLKEEYVKAAESGNEDEMKRLKSITLFKDAWFELSVTKRTAEKEKGKKRRKWTEWEADLEEDDVTDTGKDVQYIVTYEKKGGGPDEKAKRQEQVLFQAAGIVLAEILAPSDVRAQKQEGKDRRTRKKQGEVGRHSKGTPRICENREGDERRRGGRNPGHLRRRRCLQRGREIRRILCAGDEPRRSCEGALCDIEDEVADRILFQDDEDEHRCETGVPDEDGAHKRALHRRLPCPPDSQIHDVRALCGRREQGCCARKGREFDRHG